MCYIYMLYTMYERTSHITFACMLGLSVAHAGSFMDGVVRWMHCCYIVWLSCCMKQECGRVPAGDVCWWWWCGTWSGWRDRQLCIASMAFCILGMTAILDHCAPECDCICHGAMLIWQTCITHHRMLYTITCLCAWIFFLVGWLIVMFITQRRVG